MTPMQTVANASEGPARHQLAQQAEREDAGDHERDQTNDAT
jgi:hypothetical protein